MVTQQTAIDTARSFVRDCRAAGLHFQKVLLFGSYASGRMHDGSDIDLLLVSSRFTDNIFDNLRLYSKVNIKYPIIETHPYPLKQYREGDAFIQSLEKEGIEIV